MQPTGPSHRPALYTNLYVDMDGCLSDFKSFYEKYDARGVEAPGEIENAVKFKAAILDGIFERLTVMLNFHSLIQGISEFQEETGIEVHVLSSTGTLKRIEGNYMCGICPPHCLCRALRNFATFLTNCGQISISLA